MGKNNGIEQAYGPGTIKTKTNFQQIFSFELKFWIEYFSFYSLLFSFPVLKFNKFCWIIFEMAKTLLMLHNQNHTYKQKQAFYAHVETAAFVCEWAGFWVWTWEREKEHQNGRKSGSAQCEQKDTKPHKTDLFSFYCNFPVNKVIKCETHFMAQIVRSAQQNMLLHIYCRFVFGISFIPVPHRFTYFSFFSAFDGSLTHFAL